MFSDSNSLILGTPAASPMDGNTVTHQGIFVGAGMPNDLVIKQFKSYKITTKYMQIIHAKYIQKDKAMQNQKPKNL